MENLIQDTLKKIETRHITPEPRWIYLVKKYGLWLLAATVLILGATSLSVAFDNSISLDWDLYLFTHQSRLAHFLSILPYFWIILLGLFLAVAFWEIRKTENGYRYSWSRMALITVGGIAIFGILFSLFGIGGRLNSKLAKDVPFYGKHMVITRESQWTRPENGFLGGTISSVLTNELEIKDLGGEKWNIDIDDKTIIKPSVDISQDEMIKIIGTQTDEKNFKAKEIRPWAGRGMMNGKGYSRGMMRGN
jgi:hypothetical protein